jgi:hypothetical protein
MVVEAGFPGISRIFDRFVDELGLLEHGLNLSSLEK